MIPVAIDVFCGAGGMSEGLSLAGFDVRLAIDSDIYSYAVYTANHPNTPVLWKDVRELKRMEVPLRVVGLRKKQVALIAGGPPCQGFSSANRRTNHTGNIHNQMTRHFLRFVKEIKPPGVLLENVEGMKSFDDGRVLESFVSSLDKIGYDVSVGTINAADYGVPQSRRRLFIVGSLSGGFEWPKRTHGEEAKKPWVTVREAILGDLPPLNGSIGQRNVGYLTVPTSSYQRYVRRGCSVLYDHVTTASTDRVRKRFSIVPQGSGLFYLDREGKVPNELKILVGHGGVYRRLDPDLPSLTITNVGRSMTIHPEENRILSLREAARLQSFRDGYRFNGSISKMQQIIANAAPPRLIRAVASSFIGLET